MCTSGAEQPTDPPTPATRGELATLWVDRSGAAFNVALVCRFEAGPFLGPEGTVDLAAVRAEVVRRAAGIPGLRRRLTAGPPPAWVREVLRAEEHVDCVVLPAGTCLLDWCAARITEPLDRGRPLWRAWVVGTTGPEFVLLFVAHHVLVDGRHGAAIVRALLDDPSLGSQPAGPPAPRPSAVAVPGRRRWQRWWDAIGDLRGRAPRTSLSRPIGAHRRIAVVQVELDTLRALMATSGATVNDVLLSAVTAGLRALLAGRGDPVDQLTMRASVPVSSGGSGQPEGMLLVPLPVSESDPSRRLVTITATTTALKRRLRSGGGSAFDVLRLPTPLARAAVLLMQRIAARGISLFVTNVAGPAEPLSLAGARLLSAVPVAPLTADVPLGIAALSYAGSLAVAVNADGAIDDIEVFRAAVEREFATLGAACSADGALSRWARPPGPGN